MGLNERVVAINELPNLVQADSKIDGLIRKKLWGEFLVYLFHAIEPVSVNHQADCELARQVSVRNCGFYDDLAVALHDLNV